MSRKEAKITNVNDILAQRNMRAILFELDTKIALLRVKRDRLDSTLKAFEAKCNDIVSASQCTEPCKWDDVLSCGPPEETLKSYVQAREEWERAQAYRQQVDPAGGPARQRLRALRDREMAEKFSRFDEKYWSNQ
jgi:hypothetical protein